MKNVNHENGHRVAVGRLPDACRLRAGRNERRGAGRGRGVGGGNRMLSSETYGGPEHTHGSASGLRTSTVCDTSL